MLRGVESVSWKGWQDKNFQTSGKCTTTSPFRTNDFRPSHQRRTIPPGRPPSVSSPPLLPSPVSPPRTQEIDNYRVARNAEFVPPYGLGASMYLRPLLLGTGPELGLSPPQEFTFVVFVTPGLSHAFRYPNLQWETTTPEE